MTAWDRFDDAVNAESTASLLLAWAARSYVEALDSGDRLAAQAGLSVLRRRVAEMSDASNRREAAGAALHA
jgi:hypothetical protein